MDQRPAWPHFTVITRWTDYALDTYTQIHLVQWATQMSWMKFSVIVDSNSEVFRGSKSSPQKQKEKSKGFLSKGLREIRLLLEPWLIQDWQWEDIRQALAVQWTDGPALSVLLTWVADPFNTHKHSEKSNDSRDETRF